MWIGRSAIVKHTFVAARGRPGGVNLGLQRIGVSIWWQGRGGLILSRMKQAIRTMLKFEDQPHVIVIHIGGNDLGREKTKVLCDKLREFMSWLAKVMPTTVLVWSQILPRLQWRYSNNLKAMEKSRVRVNTSIASYLTKSSGCYIRYIKANHRFLGEDGVHLSGLGNDVFLNTLQRGIEKIVNNLGVNLTFPGVQSG